jgi:hypothetical protein
MPKPLADKRIVATYLPPAEIAQLDAAADEDGLSRAAFVRTTIVRELTRRSRAAQGFDAVVRDPAVLARVAELLDQASE